MRADEKSKKVKVKMEMHPNLLNVPPLCESLCVLFSLRFENHKGTKEYTRLTKTLSLLVGRKAN